MLIILSKISTHKLHGYFCLLVQTSNKTWQTIAILAFLCWPLEYCSLMAKQYLTMPLKTSQMVSSLINSQLISTRNYTNTMLPYLNVIFSFQKNRLATIGMLDALRIVIVYAEESLNLQDKLSNLLETKQKMQGLNTTENQTADG